MKKNTEAEIKKISNINVVPSTKGGVGKSTFSNQVLPLLLFLNEDNAKKTLKIFEIDDNNKSRINFVDKRISLSTFKINQSDDVLEGLSNELLGNDNMLSIIDCGGGNDSKAVLEHLNKNYLFNCNYFIPILGGEDIKNAKETIEEIRKYDSGANITLVLNRISHLDEKSIQEEFWNFYGDVNIGEPDHSEELDIDNIYFVSNLSIFSKLSSLRISLHDTYLGTLEKEPNIMNLRLEWKKKSADEETKNFRLFKFGKECVNGVKAILSFNQEQAKARN